MATDTTETFALKDRNEVSPEEYLERLLAKAEVGAMIMRVRNVMHAWAEKSSIQRIGIQVGNHIASIPADNQDFQKEVRSVALPVSALGAIPRFFLDEYFSGEYSEEIAALYDAGFLPPDQYPEITMEEVDDGSGKMSLNEIVRILRDMQRIEGQDETVEYAFGRRFPLNNSASGRARSFFQNVVGDADLSSFQPNDLAHLVLELYPDLEGSFPEEDYFPALLEAVAKLAIRGTEPPT